MGLSYIVVREMACCMGPLHFYWCFRLRSIGFNGLVASQAFCVKVKDRPQGTWGNQVEEMENKAVQVDKGRWKN